MFEELIQRGYLVSGKLKGTRFGKYQEFNIGSTTISALIKAGIFAVTPTSVKFTFTRYIPPKRVKMARPDRLFAIERDNTLSVVAIAEHKTPSKLVGHDALIYSAEQGLFSAVALGAKVAIATDGTRDYYVDINTSLERDEVIFFNEERSLNPAVIDDLLTGMIITRDPAELAEKVWQIIWHATKDEPKECLLTFVELFLLKFLSDNLAVSVLPNSHRFYELLIDEKKFYEKYGKTQIEYYIESIRPTIKSIFPDNTICDDASIPPLFDLATVVSKTSVINGFSFLRSSVASPSSFNKAFCDILKEFDAFGSLTSIDPEFKLRLYETFLKKSVRQAKLGQFFTPRNVVRPIIKMAQIALLPNGAICLDPAAGVGGFVLEPFLLDNSLKENLQFVSGQPQQKIKFIGIDVDSRTHILAKANTLIHFAEEVRNPAVTTSALNKLMARMFILMNGNETLGSLENPPINSVDLIMTNPPYVTNGSKIYKETLSTITGMRNGKQLNEYYRGAGLGLESLFLRYISGALKPGGRAFIIVPQGLLTRTETGTKHMVLSECNLLLSISLPRNTFFNTAQKTYIIGLEKRHTEVDPRPNVFCAIAQSIGETLDARRISTPDDNMLDNIADCFIEYDVNGTAPEVASVKIIDATCFSENDRWDVRRFWTDDELVALGERETAIDRVDYIDDVLEQISTLQLEFVEAKEELKHLAEFSGRRVYIGNGQLFNVRRGKRVTRKDCDLNPGNIPVYSGSKDIERPLGMISEEWLADKDIPIEDNPIITVNANGYVGAVFVRRERCVIHDDVMVIEVLDGKIDLNFLKYQLQNAIEQGDYEYEAKLYSRVKELCIEIPVTEMDEFDIQLQNKIANAYVRFDTVKQKLAELGEWSTDVRFKA